ncbi:MULTISPECIES: GtrA family protein [Streptomyces]|uniref:GtrA family protein n=1 Tax=Streptomyces ardesiacus TaxID=285564 RepID=A0ABW8HAY6_9ACTN|nr:MULTISPECIES: GtrA family protein [Streptomyces]MCL7368019.1 GtrA family protein [Streptomyces ardesiacus]
MRTAPAPSATTRPTARQITVFAVVGVVNTGTYYGLYLLFLLRLPYLLAHVLAFLLSMVGSFFLNARFTYRTRPTWRKFLLFPLTNAANFAITTAGVYLIVDVLRAGSRFAPLLASAAAIPVTFVVSRWIMLPRAGDQSAPGGRRGGGPPGRSPADTGDHLTV